MIQRNYIWILRTRINLFMENNISFIVLIFKKNDGLIWRLTLKVV